MSSDVERLERCLECLKFTKFYIILECFRTWTYNVVFPATASHRRFASQVDSALFCTWHCWQHQVASVHSSHVVTWPVYQMHQASSKGQSGAKCHWKLYFTDFTDFTVCLQKKGDLSTSSHWPWEQVAHFSMFQFTCWVSESYFQSQDTLNKL